MTKRSRKQKQERRRCAVYTRKSTSRGLDMKFNSLDAQLEACEKHIQAKDGEGWEMTPETYSDGGFTGANLDRPGFKKLMTDVEAGNIDIIVVYKVDRLSRSLLDFAKLMDRFDKFGVAFVSVTQNFSTADAIGRLTLNMLMSFAEFERSMIAERTRDKIAASRRRGIWTGGSPPFGYDVIDKQLVVNELEAIVVREMFDLYERHRSALVVAQQLNDAGRKTKRHRTASGVVRGGKDWRKSTVARTLKDAVLTGYITHDGELYEGKHEAILETDLFQRVGAILASNSSKKRKGYRNPEYVLQGVIRCSLCKMAMTPASTRKKGIEYRYYRCQSKTKKGAKSCSSRPLSADAIESYVVEQLRVAVASDNFADELLEKVRSRIEEHRKLLLKEQRELKKHALVVRAEIDGFIETLPTTTGSVADALSEKIASLLEKREEAEARLVSVQHTLEDLTKREVEAEWVADRLEDFAETWEVMLPPARGRMVTALIKRIDVDEAGGSVAIELGALELPAQEAA